MSSSTNNAMCCSSYVFLQKQTKGPTSSPTTLSPTKSCGDGSCAVNENKNTCLIDCGSKSLIASTSRTNGAPGAMFFVKPLRDVEITSFGFYRNSADTNRVEIWTRTGTYQDNKMSSNGWFLVYDSLVTSQGGISNTGNFNVTVPSNTIQSFYIYTEDIVMYSVGSEEGALFSSNESLEFYEGIGMTQKFDGQVVGYVLGRYYIYFFGHSCSLSFLFEFRHRHECLQEK